MAGTHPSTALRCCCTSSALFSPPDIASKAMSNFVYILGGVGIYVVLLGAFGMVMLNRRRRGCISLYSVCFFLLLALHTALVVGFFAYEDRTIEILQKLNSHGDNEAIRRWLDGHRDDLKWGSIAVLSVEFVSFVLSIFCVRRLSGAGAGFDSIDLDDRSVGLLTGDATYTETSATPRTDLRRAALNEKYGGAFEQKRTVTTFSTNNYAKV
jgi:hypothetical protein